MNLMKGPEVLRKTRDQACSTFILDVLNNESNHFYPSDLRISDLAAIGVLNC